MRSSYLKKKPRKESHIQTVRQEFIGLVYNFIDFSHSGVHTADKAIDRIVRFFNIKGIS